MAKIRLMLVVAVALLQAAAAPLNTPILRLWRLQCGEFAIDDMSRVFSDTFGYRAAPIRLTDSCYLIQHDRSYLLWDAGLTDQLAGRSFKMPNQTLSLDASIAQQLKVLQLTPQNIGILAISHYHSDHTGQAHLFPNAKLLIGEADWTLLKVGGEKVQMAADDLEHWLAGDGKVETTEGDHDVFGDGTVVMLSTPGHTPGHNALLVRLKSGPVLLSGDLYHFRGQVSRHEVPAINSDRADTLASMARFDAIATHLKAKVVIQHDPADISKLAAFPEATQ